MGHLKADSIKEATREKRGKGLRRKVEEKTKMPGNFADFLRDPTNKEELFGLLTIKVTSCDYGSGKDVYITSGKYQMSYNSLLYVECAFKHVVKPNIKPCDIE